MLCLLRWPLEWHCGDTVVIVGILHVVALWWHCDDTVVSVVVSVHCGGTVVVLCSLW